LQYLHGDLEVFPEVFLFYILAWALLIPLRLDIALPVFDNALQPNQRIFPEIPHKHFAAFLLPLYLNQYHMRDVMFFSKETFLSKTS